MFNKLKQALHLASIALVAAIALSGCNASKNVLYMQNLTPEAVITQISSEPVKVQPGDEIAVYINSTDPELSMRLTQMSGNRSLSTLHNARTSSTYNGNNSASLPYTVNKAGNIQMPEIGDVHVAGLTRAQIAAEIESKIISNRIAKANSFTVVVQFANLTFSTLGEVKNVGSYAIQKDNLTLLEALSIAGDLTIYGKRDAVWVLREEADGSRKAYKLNLLGSDFMTSPAYLVQQNDVIYVEPNDVRAGQSTLNENTFKSVGFWTSLVSVAVSVATLIVTLTR